MRRLSCLVAIWVLAGGFALFPTKILAQPKTEAHTVGPIEAVSAGDYWTPQRRSAAIPRDQTANASSPSLEPAAAGGPTRVDVPGAPPMTSLVNSGQPGADSGAPSSRAALAPAGEGYWTPERRLKAQPREALVDGNDSPASSETQAAATTDPQLTNYTYPFTRYQNLSQLYYYPQRIYPYTAVGKLFFTLSGLDYVCSASVIRPHLLLTARHCIRDYTNGIWATNVVFYPGYYSGPNTYLGGVWAARILRTWVSGAAGLQYDVGFIQTFNQNQTGCLPGAGNPQIESYTGYLGYTYNGSYTQRHWDVLGYPQASPFNGTRMVQCESQTGQLNQCGETNTVEVGCDQTGGSSGGPWLGTFKPGVSGTANLANGVNSYKCLNPSRPSAMNSPQFMTGNFYNLLVPAIADPCP